MKKPMLAFAILTMVIIVFVSSFFALSSAVAEESYTVKHVDHTITVLYNGYVLMNDTIALSGQLPASFFLGFPYKFGAYVVQAFAFDGSNQSNTYAVSLGEPLEDHSGFYGLRIDFSTIAPQNFSVEVLFSNGMVAQDPQNASSYAVIFPAFPSLVVPADSCDSSVILPSGATYSTGTVNNLTYGQQNLAPFTYNSSGVVFTLLGQKMQIFDVDQMSRQIDVSQSEDITGSDSYYMTNKGQSVISSVDVVLPDGASGVNAADQFGRPMAQPTQTETNTSRYSVNLTMPVDPGKSTKFVVAYQLPAEDYLSRQGTSNNFLLTMTFFQNLDYYVNATAVTFVLPEGAGIKTYESTVKAASYSISKDVFQEKLSISKQDVTFLDVFDVEIVYEYNPLWSAFRPTTWVMTLAIIGAVVALVLRRPKALARAPVAVPTTGLRPHAESIKSFVESYQERMKLMSEIDALQSRVQKGRMPRQRYKVQRRMLETRLDALNRNLGELKETMRSASSHYASLIRELEVAETEINEVETNIKSIEARHSRGEISMETYRRLLGDYQRRKEKTETTINGILLRLREEIQ